MGCRCSSLYQGCDAATRRNFTLSDIPLSSQVRDRGVLSCQGLRWRFQWLYPHSNKPTDDLTTQGIILKRPWLTTAQGGRTTATGGRRKRKGTRADPPNDL